MRYTLIESENSQLYLVGILLVAVALVMGLLTSWRLLTPSVLVSMGFQLPLIAILSLAQMGPLLTGGPDLSIVSVATLCGVVSATLVQNLTGWYAVPVAIVAALIVGLLCGAFNAFVIAILWVPSIIATLGTMIFIQGIVLVITRGRTIAGFPSSYLMIGQGRILGFVPVPFVIFLVCLALMVVLLSRTRYGISVRMLGSNDVASLFSGVNNRAVIFRTFVLSGFLSSVAALVLITRFNAAQATYGQGYLLLTVLACVLGGISPAGGIGKAIGVLLAVAVLQVVSTSFNLLGFSSHLATASWGIILIAVIILNRALFKQQA
ncbi:MAG: ABC transporter permease [Spirochaetaceae bacterium]|nr:MAG: ABC transporter permease [Spirochaetaceae bacterium]